MILYDDSIMAIVASRPWLTSYLLCSICDVPFWGGQGCREATVQGYNLSSNCKNLIDHFFRPSGIGIYIMQHLT